MSDLAIPASAFVGEALPIESGLVLRGNRVHGGLLGRPSLVSSMVSFEWITRVLEISDLKFYNTDTVSDDGYESHLSGCREKDGAAHAADTQELKDTIDDIKWIRRRGGKVTGHVELNDDGSIRAIHYRHQR